MRTEEFPSDPLSSWKSIMALRTPNELMNTSDDDDNDDSDDESWINGETNVIV
jgi:hypothetical protein